MNDIQELIKKIKANGCKYISLEYTNSNEETARYTLQTGFSYKKVVEKSLLELIVSNTADVIDDLIEVSAINDLKDSFQKTLNGTQDQYTKAGYYTKFKDESGNTVSGLKINHKNNKVHLNGLIHSKVVIKKGKDKKYSVSKNPVIAKKQEIRKTLSISKFREFKLDVEVLSTAKLNGDVLTFQ